MNVALSHGSLASTAAARVSDRVLRDTINIHTYPPVYNYLTKELELSSVQWLDRNLFAVEEIKEVYKELSKSKSTQYLNFDEDPMIEPALTNIRWSLKKKNPQRFINPQLKRQNTNAMSHRTLTTCGRRSTCMIVAIVTMRRTRGGDCSSYDETRGRRGGGRRWRL